MLNLRCREISGVPFSLARSLIGKVPQDELGSLTRAKRNREGGNACRDCARTRHTSLLLQLQRQKKLTAKCYHMLETQRGSTRADSSSVCLCHSYQTAPTKAPWNSSPVPGAVRTANGCRMCAPVPRYNGSLFAVCIPQSKQVFKWWKVCCQNLPCSVNSLNMFACPRGPYWDHRMNRIL